MPTESVTTIDVGDPTGLDGAAVIADLQAKGAIVLYSTASSATFVLGKVISFSVENPEITDVDAGGTVRPTVTLLISSGPEVVDPGDHGGGGGGGGGGGSGGGVTIPDIPGTRVVFPAMRYADTQFFLQFDFISKLQKGESITVAAIAVAVASGVDPGPGDIVQDAPVAVGSRVVQKIDPMNPIPGVIYNVGCTIGTSTQRSILLHGFLAVEDQSA